jgi:acetylornithine deacetylase/succinyl-diaminopimelate desuccinylase-like protein
VEDHLEHALRARIKELMPQAKADLAHMVSVPSVADPSQYDQQPCVELAEWIKDQIAGAGIQDAQLVHPPDGHPAVYGHSPGPKGAPTVLLYCHYDVQPPLGESEWTTPPFEMHERDGRWYGRGTADCKGNIALHLTALRALGGGDFPVGIKFIAEGAEEQGTGGIEEFVAANGEMFEADVVIVADTGNWEVGLPTLTTSLRGVANVVVRVRALGSAMHSGVFGGGAPDALQALARMLASLHDDTGNTTVDGLDNQQKWDGQQYSDEKFRSDAMVLDGVELIGSGTISDAIWSRPAITVLGIDCPPVIGSSSSIPPEASARLSLRVPPGMDGQAAQDALIAHLKAHAPWGVDLAFEPEAAADPFSAKLDGPAYSAMEKAMQGAYGREMTTQGQGGSIPLCNVFEETLTNAEIILMGCEEPLCLIHAPNESVDPSEIENMALVEALFLRDFAKNS